jgi:hypothetical protein
MPLNSCAVVSCVICCRCLFAEPQATTLRLLNHNTAAAAAAAAPTAAAPANYHPQSRRHVPCLS